MFSAGFQAKIGMFFADMAITAGIFIVILVAIIIYEKRKK